MRHARGGVHVLRLSSALPSSPSLCPARNSARLPLAWRTCGAARGQGRAPEPMLARPPLQTSAATMAAVLEDAQLSDEVGPAGGGACKRAASGGRAQ